MNDELWGCPVTCAGPEECAVEVVEGLRADEPGDLSPEAMERFRAVVDLNRKRFDERDCDFLPRYADIDFNPQVLLAFKRGSEEHSQAFAGREWPWHHHYLFAMSYGDNIRCFSEQVYWDCQDVADSLEAPINVDKVVGSLLRESR
jgi:hypothetical protein